MSSPGALCPVCDQASSAGDRCAGCGGALVLDGRFTLERLLGAGGQSRVYAGRDGRDGSVVAIKIMSIARVRDWKNVELFRRSAQVLAGLDHPGVPRLVAYFEETRPGVALYGLVHELVDGETLAEAQKRGERFDEAGARRLLEELLRILAYLHGLSPPVIHRDVKPSNLMRRRDGRLVLIDFDLVRDVLRPDGGSTMSAGTPGYSPMEQYVGEATPATDLYAAGVTLAVLLARKEPLALRKPGRQELDVRRHVQASDGLLRILERMVEAEPARRYQRAEEVLTDLLRPAPPPRAAAPPAPAGRWLPIAAGAGALIAMGAVAAIFVRTGAEADPPPPARAAAPLPAPRPPAPPAPPPRPVLATHLSAAEVEGALLAGPWEGEVDGTPLRLALRKKGGRLEAELLPGGGRPRTFHVEIAPLGSVVLRGRAVIDGVTTEETFYGELTEDRASLVGVRETRYTSAGSSYLTEHPFTARRTKGAP